MPGAYVDPTSRRRGWPIAGAVFVVVAAVTVGSVVFVQSRVIDAPMIAPIGGNATTVYDAFDGPSGQRVNPTLWSSPPDDSGAVENDLRYSTSQDNASLDGAGRMSITTLKTAEGVTSAQLTSTSTFTFGRVEARIEIPANAGLYPSFGLISTDLGATGEPAGVIDAVEATGDGEFRSGIGTETGVLSSMSTTPLPSDGYHVYWVERRPGVVTIGTDSTVIHRATADDLGAGTEDWVFDAPFRVQFDLRVGPAVSKPPVSTESPSIMSVDWVRARSD
nr:glycoside hydrolase family 16 protein [uncultured Rhodococcus sp.]